MFFFLLRSGSRRWPQNLPSLVARPHCANHAGALLPSRLGAGNSWISDDRFESRALRLHPNAAIVPQHLFRDMIGNVHDGLVACAALRKLGDQGVPVSSWAKSQCPAACSGERREIRRSGLPTRTQDSRVRPPSSQDEKIPACREPIPNKGGAGTGDSEHLVTCQ